MANHMQFLVALFLSLAFCALSLTVEQRKHSRSQPAHMRGALTGLDGSGEMSLSLESMYSVEPLKLELCHTNPGFPTYIVAVKADQHWKVRAKNLLWKNGLCEAFHVDRTPSTSNDQVEHSFANIQTLGLSHQRQLSLVKNNGTGPRPAWRDVDATGGHLRALMHIAERGSPQALVLEDDAEFWVDPATLKSLVFAVSARSSRRSPSHYSMLGGCWGIPTPPDWEMVGKELLPGSSRLFKSPTKSTQGSRCAHAYTVSSKGARMLLDTASSLTGTVLTIDHFFNKLHSMNAALMCTWVEPPVACQVRGTYRGSMECFAGCRKHESRCPRKIQPRQTLETDACGWMPATDNFASKSCN